MGTERQRRIRYPVSTPMEPDELAVIDRAAAIRSESRASYIRRIAIREARADIRRVEQKQDAESVMGG